MVWHPTLKKAECITPMAMSVFQKQQYRRWATQGETERLVTLDERQGIAYVREPGSSPSATNVRGLGGRAQSMSTNIDWAQVTRAGFGLLLAGLALVLLCKYLVLPALAPALR